jgi:hypothetical protein
VIRSVSASATSTEPAAGVGLGRATASWPWSVSVETIRRKARREERTIKTFIIVADLLE